MAGPARVLFVCVHNAGRSQMAEAFARRHAPHLDCTSAGTEPAPRLNPVVVEAMREVGIDMAGQAPRMLTGEMTGGGGRVVVVSMGCMDAQSCPAPRTGGVVEWDIPDPSGCDLDRVRQIRDQVEWHVLRLARLIDAGRPPR